MRKKQQDNLRRLLNPRHIAFVGGNAAEFSAGLCAKAGFVGKIWGVSPSRESMAGFPCFKTVNDLPDSPDAVFLAVPHRYAVETIAQLNSIGTGGIACFTAGFGELGGDGTDREKSLIAAAGDMALIGPNCQGLLNYISGAHLWSFGFPIESFARGAAIVSQSGMLCSNITMNQRSVPFSYVISAGNQAVLAVEDYLDVLLEDDAVTAVGLYVESLKNIHRFSEMAIKALDLGKPIVALKGGSSDIGAQLTVTHTGAMMGSEKLYSALFDRLGVIEVDSPAAMLETIKLVSVAGAPAGTRVAAFTLSGGDAALLADVSAKIGLTLPPPGPNTATSLREQLPDIATVSNPLDLTTPLWGDSERVTQVVSTLLADGFDATVLVQDYPMPDMDVSNLEYRRDAQSLTCAASAAGIPAAVVSSLSENIDRETRDWLIENNVAPLQGIEESVKAIRAASRFGLRTNERNNHIHDCWETHPRDLSIASAKTLNESEAKNRLARAGIAVPEGQIILADTLDENALDIDYPIAVKLLSEKLSHKTEAGAVALNINNFSQLRIAIDSIKSSVSEHSSNVYTNQFLAEAMIKNVVAEVLIGIRYDIQFGYTMLLASGGIWVEIMDDAQTLLLPTHHEAVADALSKLKVSSLIDGYRGKPRGDRKALIDTAVNVGKFALDAPSAVLELDINPVMVLEHGVVAADALLRIDGSVHHN